MPGALSAAIWNDTTYLGKYQIIPGRLADGYPLAAVTLIPESGYRHRAQTARIGWILGSLGFLAGMLVLAAALSRRFATPIAQGFAAARSQAQDWQPTGIREIDELTAYFHSRLRESQPEAALPRQVESLVSELIDRAKGLTGTERVILRYCSSHQRPPCGARHRSFDGRRSTDAGRAGAGR